MELIILDENSSFSDWANKWKTRKIIGISKAYQTAVNSQVNYLTNFFGDISINRIKPMHIDELISKLAIENPKTHRPSSKKSKIQQLIYLSMLLTTLIMTVILR